jgi:hypothetical protein
MNRRLLTAVLATIASQDNARASMAEIQAHTRARPKPGRKEKKKMKRALQRYRLHQNATKGSE